MIQQDVLRSGGGSHRVFLQKMEQGEGSLRRLWHKTSLYHRAVLAVEQLQYRPYSYKRILAVSQEVRREIVATYGVPEDRVAVIYNGVDHERFHPRHRETAGAKIRAQWGIPVEAPLMLFVGSGFQRKGLDRLLRAWESPRFREIYLLVVGEDAQRSRYAARAQRQSQGRILFAGRQEAVEDFYGAADLLALPAFQEAFGNVVLEALASGLPVLVSRAVGAAEVLTGELAQGILESPDDPSEIEGKVLRMLDGGRWRSMSDQARKLGERYSWKNHFREFETHLQEVAGRDRASSS
jgi:UDP-glucose:(heptosyl)LPS alpha-1,3-glucosyltransferase